VNLIFQNVSMGIRKNSKDEDAYDMTSGS
jgi:hypothetical protein